MRRLILTGLAVLALAACNKSGGTGAVGDDMTMGNPAAKVTVTEYASVACPICAVFNNTVFPEFKKKYIDTGKVHYVAREALTGNPALAASGFLIARCAGQDKYFKVTDAIFRAQEDIYEPGTENVAPGTGRDILLHIAQSAGLSEDQFNKCIGDEKAIAALNERAERLGKKDDVEGTPTFLINGKKFKTGMTTMADLDAAIQPLLR